MYTLFRYEHYVSNDNGSTWSAALAPSPLGVDATWALKAIQLPGNSATTKIKFTGTSDYGNDDMGIDELRVCVPYTPSASPITFAATAVALTSMTIGWTDNSTDEIGFRVYRSTDNITFTKIGSDIASTTVLGTGTAYSQAQTGLVPGTTYYYRIVAFADYETAPLTGTQATLPALLINSIADGAWSATTTWSTGTVPTAGDFVTIQNNVNVDVATAACYKLTINSGKTLSCTTGTTSVLTIGSDLTNNGTLNFWVSATQLAGLTFIEPNNNTFSGTGTTNINTLVINKGTTNASILELNLPNFSVKGLSSAAVGFLTLTKGTLKVSGTNTFNGAVFTTTGYSIVAAAGFWLNNPNFTVNGQGGSPTLAGMLRITQGTFNVGTASGNSMGFSTGANVIIEGGAVNAAGRFGVAAATNSITYNQSGGTVTVCRVANTSASLYSFDLGTSLTSSIIWTAGNVVLQKASSGTTHRDYRNQAGDGNLGGGTLQIGNASSGAAGAFNIFAVVPNLVIDPTYAHTVTFLVSTTNYYSNTNDITIGTGTKLILPNDLFLFFGTTLTNNGTLVDTASAGRLYFSSTVAQTYTGTGVVTAPLTSLDIDTDIGVAFTSTNTVPVGRIDLFGGNITGSNKLTLGNGAATTGVVQIGNASQPPSAGGTFDLPLNFNLGTGGEVIYYSNTVPSLTTGYEVNPARVLTYLGCGDSLKTLTIAGGPLSTGTLALTNGILNSTAANLLTVTGTTPASISGGSANSYVNGPLAITLPASLATGTTYKFPVGKSAYKPLELVNPITSAGGTAVVQSEVFDANCGGTPGTGLGLLSTNRYWKSSVISGAGTITGTAVRLTESGLTVANAMGKSGSVNGTYNLVSSLPPTATTIISDNITSLGYFAIGTLSVAVSGTLQGTVYDGASNPLPGATVSFGANTTTSAIDGTYQFLNVFNGTYSVTCSKDGYITSTDPNVVIVATQTTIKNFTLNFQLDKPVNLQGVVQNVTTAHLTWLAPGSDSFQDGFENYTDFSINFPPWITTDVDGGATYGITNYTWPNAGTPQAFIVFNSNTTTPAMSSNLAHSGNKFAACFATVTASAPNNDWLISPSTYIVTGSVLKFWARTYDDTYGLERFKVGISTTGTATTDFSIISAGSYVEAPLAWTQYTYDLSAYVGQSIHVAINCVSNDAFIFMVDDFSIGVPAKSFTREENPVVNPFQGMEQMRATGKSLIRNGALASNKVTRCNVVPSNNLPALKQGLTNQGVNNSNAPLGPWSLTGYNVYRDGNKISGATPITNLYYNDMGLASGTYHYTVTSVYPQGESAAAGPVDVTIFAPTLLTVTGIVTNVTPCAGGNNGAISTTVTGGVSPYGYYWSNGATTASLTGLSAGIYAVTVTDASFVTTTGSWVVSQPDNISLSAIAVNTSCSATNDGSIDLTVAGGTPGYTYLWSNSATTEDISGLAAGTYTVVVTDANGCQKSGNWTIDQPTAISLSATTVSATCPATSNGSIDLTAVGGNPVYTYAWSNSATTQDISGLAAGTYTVVVTDSHGCQKTGNWTVGVIDPVCDNLSVTGTVSGTVCYNAHNTITVAGGTSTFIVSAPNGNATFISNQNIKFEPGTHVEYNAYMHGYISSTFCINPNVPITAAASGQDEPQLNLQHAWFTLYPNPTSGNFTLVQKGENAYGSVKVEIYSMNGEKVMTEQMIGEKSHEFHFSSIPVGLYFVKVVADDYVETIKLIKTR